MFYNKLNKNLQIIISLSIMIIIVCGSFTSIHAQDLNQNKDLIKIGFDLWVPDLLTYIAQEKGFFKQNNLDINLTLVKTYNNATNLYSNGDFDGIFTVYSDAIIQQSEGTDTKVVYNVDSSSYADAIVGNGNNISDAKGKKIGVDGINTFSHFFVLKSLEKAGLSEGDVEFVNVPVQNVTEALQKGQIFAGHTYDPFISDAVKKGFKILSTGATVPGIITSVLIFHSDMVNQRPQDIKNFIKSLIEAKQDYEKNKDQDISIMASKSGLSKEKIIEGMNSVKLLDLNYNNQFSMNKSSNQTTSLYKSGNEIAKFYAERGVISEYPNIDNIVDPTFVNALLNENKTNIH